MIELDFKEVVTVAVHLNIYIIFRLTIFWKDFELLML